MQMFVGLMCWFAAKVTRSPFFARFTASAMWPIAEQVVRLEQRDAVRRRRGARRARPCRDGRSDGSLISAKSSETAGDGTALLLEALDGEGDVVSAEAEAVAQHGAHGAG